MGRTYRSALGKQIDMDKLRLHNESTIAVGNMKVNARGDQLGPGGNVVKTRNEVMQEYYNTSGMIPKRTDFMPDETAILAEIEAQKRVQPEAYRGSLADQIIQRRNQRILTDQDGEQ